MDNGISGLTWLHFNVGDNTYTSIISCYKWLGALRSAGAAYQTL